MDSTGIVVYQSPKTRIVLAGQMGSGPTAFPWSFGRRKAIVLGRDSRLSLADSCIVAAAREAGSAAEGVGARKSAKYTEMATNIPANRHRVPGND